MVFLLLLTWRTAATAATGFALAHAATTTLRLVAGDAITRRQLNLELDDFIPLLIGPITLRDRQKLAQTTTVIVGRRRGRRSFKRDFGILSSHRKVKSGALF